MSKRYSKIGQNIIEWDEIYYIAYAGGKRDLLEKDMKEYNKAANSGLPDLLRAKEIAKLGLDKNPNVVPVKGIIIIEFFKDRNFVPFFSPNFMRCGYHGYRLLLLNDKIIYESIKQKSYEIAMGL